MRLSEAILLGSVGSVQGFGPPSSNPANKSTGLCAIGAALLCIGATPDSPHEFVALTKAWPWTATLVPEALEPLTLQLPVASLGEVYSAIWKLNDRCKWTRPQIAAWVAELEQTMDPQVYTAAIPNEHLVPTPTSGR